MENNTPIPAKTLADVHARLLPLVLACGFLRLNLEQQFDGSTYSYSANATGGIQAFILLITPWECLELAQLETLVTDALQVYSDKLYAAI